MTDTNLPELTVQPSAALGKQLQIFVLPIATTALLFGFALVDSRVVSPGNLINILQQTSYLSVFAVAQTIVLITRGLDLALGPTVSMVSVGAALAMTQFLDPSTTSISILLVGLLIGVGLGWLVGLFNGFVVAILRVNPFIATLGSYNIALGIATTLSGGRPVQNVPDVFTYVFYSGSVLGVPAAILFAVVIWVGLHLMLNHTIFGRSLYLIGTNVRAASVAGIPTRRVLMLAYLLCSSLSAVGALMLTARTGSGEPNLGGSLSLQALAAALVGGVSLTGGTGSVGAALLGSVFVTILSNGMNLVQLNGNIQLIVLGTIVIFGVTLDQYRTRHK